MGIAIVIALSLLDCTQSCGEPLPVEPEIPIEKFAATYERSGGLSPSMQRFVVAPGRRAIVTTTVAGEQPETVRFRLSVLTAKRLRNGLAQAHFTGQEHPPATPCADCYVYTLKYRGETVSFNQTEIPRWIKKTVGRFEALIEAHRPFH